ncbi:hypothetical protein [Flavobacterium sp. JAS]|uniref:hypothetical protein n=1 Tax=Flavobacterium sp. JAS TaxID=2897329 RepID=UPI001E50B216|nr:hypothetical protein [Flavobacterium sp. JAS]MCD0469070.1 hypothetical protein [Flavobacterium sp. JAS]
MSLKKIIFLGIIINIISLIVLYLTMHKYEKEISANCMNCSYFQDVLINGLSILIFPIVYISSRFIANKNISLVIISLYGIFNIFLAQIGIFNSRVASWSSFTNMEMITGVFLEQYLSLILIFGVFILIIKFIFLKMR